MATKRCKNCTYWRWIRDENYGEWPGQHGECMLIWELSYKDLSLTTKPEFSCALWSAKDGD